MKQNKKSLAAIVGAGIVTSLSASAVNAAENPFALKDLAQGYAQLAEATPEAPKAAAPEAKCGAEVMKKNPEMKCGASMMDMGTPKAAAPAAADVAKAVEKKCAPGMKMEKPATPAAPTTK